MQNDFRSIVKRLKIMELVKLALRLSVTEYIQNLITHQNLIRKETDNSSL